MSYLHKPTLRLPNSKRHPGLKQQQGVVIVVALFIVALCVTMAYIMMSRLARDTRRTELIVHDAQAELYADASVMWAKDQLRSDWIKQKKDKRIDVLPIKSPVNDMNGYAISSTIKDAQSRFNLNNLTKPEWQQDFVRLMRSVYPKVTQDQAVAIARAAADWITPGVKDNEYSRYYAELPVPYRAGHRMMADPGELRLVKGVTPDLYAALEPYITALPAATPINPQNAELPVIMMLSPTMTMETARAIQELLAKNPPPTLKAFLSLDIIKNHKLRGDVIAWTSTYFLVETEVRIERQRILLYTLLQRNTSAGKADVLVLWQNRGIR